MPYVLISTQIRLECGPTIVGDEWSDKELMEYLGASLLKSLGNNFLEYKSQDPPRVVLNKLEARGYKVISCAGIGQTCIWTLHKPDTLNISVNNRTTGERTYWTCSIRGKTTKCNASVKQFADFFTRGLEKHNHQADPGVGKKVKIAKNLKEVAKERMFEPAASIVERVMKEMLGPNDVNLPKPDNLCRAANHHRRQRPDDPVDLEFELQRDFIGEDFILDDPGRRPATPDFRK